MSQPFLPITHQPTTVRLPEESPVNFQFAPHGLELLRPTGTIIYRERPSYGCCVLPITEIINEYGHILFQVELQHWGCCEPRRTTVMTDMRTGSEVAHFELDQKCGCICGCFRPPELSVTVREVGSGRVLGVVRLEQVGCFKYEYKVMDGTGRMVVRVVNNTGWCTRQTYLLLNSDGVAIGRIGSEGYHYCCYRMEYPEGLDVATKATLIAFLNLMVLMRKSSD